MGYFGLPSKACAPCRSRRIKCDLSRPACGQCIRTYRTCSGYRDQTDLIFRDQTQDVTCKAQRAKRPTRKTPEYAAKRISAWRITMHEQSQFDLANYFDAAGPVALSLPLSPEHQAFCFFFNNYLSYPSKNFVTIYESIPMLYFASDYDSPLLYIVTALGLAGLSHHTETYGMEVAAGVWYNKALHKVNQILRDRTLAKEDMTLLVVLLLGLYETNTCRTPRSMNSWIRHIRGATALLDLRGEKQLDTEFGRTLFVQTRTHIIAGCVQTRTPIPNIVVRLSQKCRASKTNPLEEVIPLSFLFCNLRSTIPFHPVENQSEARTRAIIAKYSSVSEALFEWHCSLPSGFLPTKMPSEKSDPAVLSEFYDVWDDVWTAGVVNNCSTNHILVNESLLVQLAYLRDNYACNLNELVELEDRISKARNTIIYLIDTVCASVPYLLQSNLAVCGVGLLWALYVSAQISPRAAPVDKATRSWITGRLEKIGVDLGVRQATTLAGFLHKKIEVTQLLNDEFNDGDDRDEYPALMS